MKREAHLVCVFLERIEKLRGDISVCVCRAATGLRPLLTTTLTTELPKDRCCVGPIQEDRLSAGQAVVNVPLSGWGVYPALSWDGEAGGRAGGDPPSPKGG